MTIVKKNKLLLIILALFVSMGVASLSSASMHHMDSSDCMKEVTCNNCFISATTPPSKIKIYYSFLVQIFETSDFFQDNQAAPPYPPPKI
jgi:hypothetical protein